MVRYKIFFEFYVTCVSGCVCRSFRKHKRKRCQRNVSHVSWPLGVPTNNAYNSDKPAIKFYLSGNTGVNTASVTCQTSPGSLL